ADAGVRREALAEVAQDQRVEEASRAVVTGERRLRGELAAVERTRAKDSGDPRAAPRRTRGAELLREGLEAERVLAGEQAAEVQTDEVRGPAAEHVLGGAVRERDAQPGVELEDRVHRAAEEPGEALLAVLDLALGLQPS